MKVDYVAVKLMGVPPVKGVRMLLLPSMEIDVCREQKVRRCCSAANGMWLLVMVPGTMAIVISVTHRCDLISSEWNCRWSLGASKTNLLIESGDKNTFSKVVDPPWIPPKVNVFNCCLLPRFPHFRFLIRMTQKKRDWDSVGLNKS